MKKIVKVGSHIKEKNKDPYLKELYELEVEKANIAKLIIKHRLDNNMNQSQLAVKVGVTQQQISKIENGDFSSIITIAKVLLRIGYFLEIRPIKLSKSRAARLQTV
ncbi:MAG: helix-turn-helix transcriptional regulator [Candidatus Omnitrophota bacterium]